MSFNSVALAANDPDLQVRIQAAVNAEALNNPDLQDTQFAMQVKSGYVNLQAMYWAVADAVQIAYETGIDNNRGSPGHDPDVVDDGAITSAVVANWPPDPEPLPVVNPTNP